MATLHIHNLPDSVHAALRLRAAKTGRSMEDEARTILAEACLPKASTVTVNELMDWVDQLYEGRKPGHVVDDLIAERRQEAAGE